MLSLRGSNTPLLISNALGRSYRTDKFPPMIPAFLLILSAVAYRIVTGLLIHSGATWLSNFAPLAALALCGGAYFPLRFKFIVPLGALFISDVILNYHYSASLVDPHMFSRYFALALVGLIGFALQNRASFKMLL